MGLLLLLCYTIDFFFHCRVKTIRHLRVVDTSVMPNVTSGNTNVPAMMIAEKASDMIKETFRCESDIEILS